MFWTVIQKKVGLIAVYGRKGSFLEVEAWRQSPKIDAIIPHSIKVFEGMF